jgi:tRNA (uracil-5-)-methyltransferase
MKSVKLVSDEESLQVRRENRQQAAANVQESENVLEVENVLELKNVQEMEESSDKVENYPTTETAFKLRVGNLGKFVTKKNIAKFLEANKVIYKSIKSAPKWDFCMLSFESTAELDLAMETLTGREYKSNIVSLQKMAQKQERRPTTVSENVSDKPPGEQIQDQVTPLWRLGYTEQIAEKTERIEKQLQGLTKQLFKFIPKRKPDVEFDHLPTLTELHEMNPEFRGEFQLKWLKAGRKENSGKPCFLNEMVPSPVIEGYRNKCEFTFGLDLDGNRTLGFLLGNFKNGINTVINSNICLNVSPSAKSIVNVLEKCCKDSKYNVYDKVAQIGFWRSALVRTALNGDSMILVQVHPSNLSSVDLDTELNRIKDYVVHECSCLTPVTTLKSLYFQVYTFKQGL